MEMICEERERERERQRESGAIKAAKRSVLEKSRLRKKERGLSFTHCPVRTTHSWIHTQTQRDTAMSERQAFGATTGNSKPAAGQGRQGRPKALPKNDKKNDLPDDFDIDMEAPETAKAAVTIQSQFRKFQKKKQDVKS
uniref:calmodulin regulator protein PCP4a isoform X1 n=1 Tax=Solea senegalensis TaxID=28829 RepID=UPI001CD8A517|nr:calmodulin regulator protein PCP4a isoform X1 [Solea senegalensis]